MSAKRIAIFASGRGSNAKAIIDYFKNSDAIEVAVVLSNKPNAGVLETARENGIPFMVVSRYEFYKNTENVVYALKEHGVDFIALAGFLWLIPNAIINSFPKNIVNIHPSLLPKFGGKGMYGQHVHSAVIEAGEVESGITIHYVNEVYDDGEVVLQERCPVLSTDTPSELADRVLKLEHYHFPRVIERLLADG